MIAETPLNSQAIAIEDAETEIRLAVKTAFLRNIPREYLNEKVKEIIRKALRKINIPLLQSATIRSLVNFYLRQYREIRKIFNGDSEALEELLILTQSGRTEKERETVFYNLQQRGILTEFSVNLYGVPNQTYMKNYINKEVRPVLNNLAEQFATDPDDVSGRNSLRNRAEMEVRYNRHLDDINELKAAGHKLVIASTHADCSKRCAPWQGRVYSLDGTSGTTDDGRYYVPLEVATNVPYTTKAGITYMNGLLGFNCRHFLVPYKSGFSFPEPNEKEEKRQYSITVKQRELERTVRDWKIKALTNKNIDREQYLEARQQAILWNKKYINYSKQNNRAYYPDRVKII